MKVIEFKAYFNVKGFTETIEADLSIEVGENEDDHGIFKAKISHAYDWIHDNIAMDVS